MTKIDTIKKALLVALEKSLGIVATACKQVGISRQTFYNYLEDEDFAKDVKAIEETAFDYVESQMFKLIKAGNPAAIIFYAKTKMKHRGYIEKQEHEHSGRTFVVTVDE